MDMENIDNTPLYRHNILHYLKQGFGSKSLMNSWVRDIKDALIKTFNLFTNT